MGADKQITVMLVDDSSVIRAAISRILEKNPHIKIVGSVSDGQMGVTMAASRQPDVIILDVEMPVMDGLTALPEILKKSPKTKVVMCSSLTAKGAETTMKAMKLGAVECLVKPSSAQDVGPSSPFETLLINLVLSLGGKEIPSAAPSSAVIAKKEAGKFSLSSKPPAYKGKPQILAVGSSTGGPQALFQALKDIGPLNIPIVITQHMPATFTTILAKHISEQTGQTAIEGADGMTVEAGKIYIAPGGKHMLFEKRGTNLAVKLDNGPAENFCKPAVDPMLRSLIDIYGERILCMILTGMGQDGLLGARALVEKNGRVVAQDEETSVVWGMPGAVAMDGLCSAVLPLNKIGAWVKTECNKA